MNEPLRKQTILVVDDATENIDVLMRILVPKYKVKAALNGRKALEICFSVSPPDLVLLDVMMPEMDGLHVCKTLKDHPSTKNIPVIFITTKGSIKDEEEGFNAGAVDYISKPFSPPIVKARIKNHLSLYDQRIMLEMTVIERTKEVQLTQDVAIQTISSLAETRDNETGSHILRTKNYVNILGKHLQKHPKFSHELSPATIDLLTKSAPLHDIGKIGIPDNILLKPGRLTDDEFEIMKGHAAIGYKAIIKAERQLLTNFESSFLHYAREIAYTHHEKWDGSGYPRKLAGENIPVSGRLMALADVYDALITKRCYKPAFTHEKAKAIILEGSGIHFDPNVVEAFLATEQQFKEIAQRYRDEEN